MVRLVDPAPWIPLIGRLMMAFGNIEANLNNILEQWYPPKEFEYFASMQLEGRVRLIRAAAEGRREEFTDANIDTLLLNLDDVRLLAQTRNLIAHNPLVLTFFEEDGEVVDVTERIVHARRGKDINLLELEGKTLDAEKMADVLMQNQQALALWGGTNLIGDFPSKPLNIPLRRA